MVRFELTKLREPAREESSELCSERRESIEVMADRRSSDQPTPWRVRNTHNRITRSEDTVPTATIVLAGGSESIVLNHATINQISKIYRALTATRHAHEADSSKDSTTTTHLQTVKNAKRRDKKRTSIELFISFLAVS